MSFSNETLSALTKLTPDDSSDENELSASAHDQNFKNLVSNTFNIISKTDEEYKNAINTLSQSPNFTSDPEKLVMLQNYLGEYSNYVSLVSALARKAVSSIETLGKANNG